MKRIVLHIDVNSAFLSWTAAHLLEDGFSVDIRNIPSVIGGNEKTRNGIVLAGSIPAKKLGVKTGETLYSARKKVPNLKVFPPEFDLYKRKSQEMNMYFKTLTPIVEQMSIDEAYLDMSGTTYLYKDIISEAYKIKEYMKKEFGYTVNIGIGNNKLTAKMASDFEKPDKVHTLFDNEVKEKMWPLEVEKLFLVGRNTAEILRKLKINTIKDLANTSEDKLRPYFKNQTKNLIERANGIDDTIVLKELPKNKSISNSKTFVNDTNNINFLKRVLLEQTIEVGKQLREQNQLTTNVGVIFRSSDFNTYSHQRKLDNPTDVDQVIYKEVLKVFNQGWNKEQLRLIGVRLTNFTDYSVEQTTIFDQNKDGTNKKIQTTIDEITNKYGKEIIKPAKAFKGEE